MAKKYRELGAVQELLLTNDKAIPAARLWPEAARFAVLGQPSSLARQAKLGVSAMRTMLAGTGDFANLGGNDTVSAKITETRRPRLARGTERHLSLVDTQYLL